MEMPVNFQRVAPMRFSPEETETMACLNTLWLQTLDSHEDVLAYPEDVMIDHIDDLCSEKMIDRREYSEYTAENGSKWLISNNLHLEDLDAFFRYYLDLEEEVA